MRACRLAGFSRAAWYRKSRAKDQTALRMRIREIAQARPRFGYHRVYVRLRREGWRVNLKRVRRLYRLEGLQVRLRVRKQRHGALHRGPVPAPTGLQQRWSMAFVHDQLADGRGFRVLTVVDQWSRLSPILEVVQRVTGADVAAALERVRERGALPRSITARNSRRRHSMPGPMPAEWRSTSRAQANPRTTGTSSRLTPACGMSA